MALVRVAQYGASPLVVGDYQAQNAHLQAFTNQLLTQQFILDSGTAQPVIKQGTYVSHGGSLYIADADTAITGSPSDGSVYIRVSGTTTLIVEFINDISSYVWNPVYTALTSTTYTLLPYLIVKASTVWTRYNLNLNGQQFGPLASLAVTGNATVDGTIDATGDITGIYIYATLFSGPKRAIDIDHITATAESTWYTELLPYFDVPGRKLLATGTIQGLDDGSTLCTLTISHIIRSSDRMTAWGWKRTATGEGYSYLYIRNGGAVTYTGIIVL